MNDVWTPLDFQIDEPSLAQYSYESDGASFVATAVGDPGCNGNIITLQVTGRITEGEPVITEPADAVR
jgi:hypothetical protein